jgi:hypothetical protein
MKLNYKHPPATDVPYRSVLISFRKSWFRRLICPCKRCILSFPRESCNIGVPRPTRRQTESQCPGNPAAVFCGPYKEMHSCRRSSLLFWGPWMRSGIVIQGPCKRSSLLIPGPIQEKQPPVPLFQGPCKRSRPQSLCSRDHAMQENQTPVPLFQGPCSRTHA